MLPSGVPAAFEFRNASWFDDDVYTLLAHRGCALAVTETDEDASTPVVRTGAFTYARLRKTEYTDEELHAWLARLRGLQCEHMHVYFKHEDDARGPAFAQRLRALSGS